VKLALPAAALGAGGTAAAAGSAVAPAAYLKGPGPPLAALPAAPEPVNTFHQVCNYEAPGIWLGRSLLPDVAVKGQYSLQRRFQEW